MHTKSPEEIEFRTGKSHVSFSEVRCWKECAYRHKLLYIDKIGTDEPSPYLSYGTAVHEAIENFLNTGKMNSSIAIEMIENEWEKHGFDSQEFIDNHAAYRKSQGWKPKPHPPLSEWKEYAETALSSLPDFLTETFGDYEIVSAEEELYEYYAYSDIFFKGFIDALIKTKVRGKEVYYVIDWKTAGDKGWYRSKRQDILTWAQIALYKTFWRNKLGLDIKQVRCGFVLLKRGARSEDVCEFVSVSVGPKAEEKSTAILRNMVKTVRRGIFLKNRNSCLFCEFKNTPNCPGG
tara:strand:- start:70 stop:942 length:873 start_codon:yes stop_codon:yes gene_type:complete